MHPTVRLCASAIAAVACTSGALAAPGPGAVNTAAARYAVVRQTVTDDAGRIAIGDVDTQDNPALDVIRSACRPIRSVRIENGSIFDLQDPAENGLFYRLANRLHRTTRRDVIAAQLLFEPGDTLSLQEIEESERLLRSSRYIQDAHIEPVLDDDGQVDVTVSTTDVWTLMPRLSFSRSGGRNKSSIGVRDANLFGSGSLLEVNYASDVDRDGVSVAYSDNNLGASRYALHTSLARNSDGDDTYFSIGKPFYSLDARRANGVTLSDRDQIESFYTAGDAVADYRHEATRVDAFIGVSGGLRDGWTRRLTAGVTLDRHRFSDATSTELPGTVIPQDRTFAYPWVGVEWIENRYEKTRNVELINQTEDRFLGFRADARLGFAPSAFGAASDTLILDASAQKGFGSSDARSLIVGTGFTTRLAGGRAEHTALSVNAGYYHKQSAHRMLHVGVDATFGDNLDADRPLQLGGDTGLRGYPLRYQTGSRTALLTLEQRFYTDWYPFHLFHVGGAVFFDAGRAWGDSPIPDQASPWLRDVGVGLRLGNSRSGMGRMVHIDLAHPLDGGDDISSLQFLISTSKQF